MHQNFLHLQYDFLLLLMSIAGCMDSTGLTTVIETLPESSGLSGELSCIYYSNCASGSLYVNFCVIIICMQLVKLQQ